MSFFLRRLVSAQQKQNHGFLVQAVIHSIPRTVIDFQFVDALSDRTVLAQIAETDPVEPDANFLPGHDILEAVEPFLERLPARFGQIIGYRVGKGFHEKQCSI